MSDEPTQAMPTPSEPGDGTPPTDGNSTRIRIIAIVAGVVVALGVLGFLLLRDDTDRDDGAKSDTTATSTTTPESATSTSSATGSSDPNDADGSSGTTSPSNGGQNGAGPNFVSYEIPTVYACPAPDVSAPPRANTMTISWSTTGTQFVELAIDNPSGVYQSNLPANGQIEVTPPCAPNSNTYYLTAVGPAGARRTVEGTTEGR